MKKVIFKLWLLAALAFATVACSQDDGPMPTPAEEQPDCNSQVTSRTESEAIEQAICDRQNMLGISTPESRAELDVRYVTDNRNSRSGDTDTLLYVVNFPNEEGYAVIPKDNRLATLAVTESGSFTSVDAMDNPAAKDFMQTAQYYAASASLSTKPYEPVTPIQPTKQYLRFDTIKEVSVPARINLRWGQAGSLAKYATNKAPKYPNRVVGCVPLACALTLSYFEKPTSINLTFPGAPVSVAPLSWSLMKSHVKEYDVLGDNNCYCIANPTAHEQLARLLRQLGMLCNAQYNVENNEAVTRAPLTGAYNALKTLIPSVPIVLRTNLNSLKTDLQNGISIMEGTGSGAHCWICDGYYYLKYEANVYEHWGLYDSNFQPVLEYIETQGTYEMEYMHINWGWDGKDNGFYNYGVFDSYNPIIRDNAEDGKADRRTYVALDYIYVQI